MSYPLKLNMGCGPNFREDCLNLDIDPAYNPDIIFDLNQPLWESEARPFSTQRFGEIILHKNTFERIIALDVLEHLTHLVTAMTSCLDLLRLGGEMHIYTPYDLSLGAWQDPTHVRAFNENSWDYYCDEFWRLGWTKNRFERKNFSVVLSEYGEQLQKQGMPNLQLSRTPRAIDHMQVILKKARLTEKDLDLLAIKRPGR